MSDGLRIAEARQLQAAAADLFERARKSAVEITEGGRRIDDHQVLTERVAYAATEARALDETLVHLERAQAEGRTIPTIINFSTSPGMKR